MKKIFTLTLVFLAMMFGVNAQYLLQEGFETGTLPTGWVTVDADADGYCWEGSANPASYFQAGTDLSGSGHNSSNGFVLSGSYSNVYGVLTPDNWLISPAINLTANATLTFWVSAQDPDYAAEHYGLYISTTAGTTPADFTLIYEETIDENGGSRPGAWKQKSVNLASYTGQTIRIAFRHFNCSDQFVFNLDDVEIFAQPTDPTIVAATQNVDFGTALLGNSSNATLNVTGYNLTSAITATVAAPFAVSADGTTYSTTASIAAAGGTLYVQYTPTAAGTDNGTLTLSSTGATDITVSLAGTAIECNGTIPYNYSFTNDVANTCWTVIDANNDGYTFEFTTTDGYASVRYNSTLTMDDWLISPIFTLTGSEIGSFDYRAGSTSWFEKFQVFAFGANDTVTLTPVVEVHNTEYQTQYLDLSSLNGNYQIAIHGVSDPDQLRLYIANFSILSAGTADITVNPTSIDFGVLPSGNTTSSFVELTILNATDAITVSTAAPFSVSLDNTTFNTSVSIPAPTSTVFSQTVYVAYNPTAAGTHNGTVTISTTGASETVTLTGTSIDCGVITTLPFTETFDEGSPTRECWTIVDANNDGNTIEYMAYDDSNTGVAVYFYSEISNAEDWLISPEITLPAGGSYVSYDYAIASPSYPEKYSVWVIPQGSTYSNATNLLPTQTVTSSDIENNMLDLSSYSNQTIRIAFKVESDADKYWIFFDNITVSAITAPTVTITGPTSVVTGTPVTYTANSPLATSFAWTVDGTAVSSTTNTMTHTFTTGGNHTVAVTASNSLGSANASMTVSAISCDGVQSLPFTENFEGGMPACWTILDQDGDGYSWEHSYEPVSYYNGVDLSGSGNNGSDGFVLSGSYSNVIGALTPDNWLITPALAIPSTGAKLTWYVSAIDASYAAEFYDVMVSTSLNPSSFTSVFNETLQYAEFEQRQININGEFAGQNVYIAFRNHNTEDIFLMKIDDINVTAIVGVDNHEAATSIYPNPANNVLNINASCNINNVEVYNMMGQMVGSYNVNDVNTQINTTSFANGVYTVRINTENGTSTKKFTVAR